MRTDRPSALDWRVVGFTLVVSLGTGIVFGLLPALHGSRADLNTTLKRAADRRAPRSGMTRHASLLVVAEVALALILLVGSALLIRTSLALRGVDPGFDPAQHPDHANVADRAALPDRPPASSRWCATASSVCARCPESRSPAPRAACRCRVATACRSPSSGGRWPTGTVPRRRRLVHGLAGILRGVQDSGQARPLVQRCATTARRRRWW